MKLFFVEKYEPNVSDLNNLNISDVKYVIILRHAMTMYLHLLMVISCRRV